MPSSSVEIRLAVIVQHHPARAHLLPTLLPLLGECDVITDPEPDGKRAPIRTYLACLRAMPPWASHSLIVQDDVRPCTWFRGHAVAAIRERPESIVALFLGGAPVRSARLAQQAHRRGERWSRLHRSDWCPTVATVWPRSVAQAFLDFAVARPPTGTGDDSVVGEFVRANDVPVWVTVPSLVQHPDVEPSLIGRRAGAGRNRMRVAAVPPVQ